jgi:hypothetical protein
MESYKTELGQDLEIRNPDLGKKLEITEPYDL